MNLTSLLQIIEEKYAHDQIHKPHRTTHDLYLQGLQDEVSEVAQEIKPDNHVYLEDELADILRTGFNLISILAKQGYIRSPEAVLERAVDKYKERVEDKKNGILRNKTKERQKKKLNEEHIKSLQNKN